MIKGRVSFAVLNWNGLDDTLKCIDSIRKQTIPDFEIIVVDNGSLYEQKEVLRKIKNIILIDLPKNTGFSGGQIAAFNKANGEFLALINNDAVIAPDWSEKALNTFASNPKGAAVGGRAYLWDEGKGFGVFSTKNSFYSYQVVNLVSGHTKTLMYGDYEVPVDSISGAGVMIKRSAIGKVGYFDKHFFSYYEETDLFARFKRAGLEIIYNPSMHSWHKIAQSTKSKPDFYLYYMHRNRFMFAIKNFDLEYLFGFLIYYSKEWLRSLIRIIVKGKNKKIEEKNLVKAGVWVFFNMIPLLLRRQSTRKLGASYSTKLLKDSGESITVIIPCYNYASFVAEAIESVFGQTLTPNEIIVINDGSTDNSLKVINKYKDRLTIIDQINKGVVETKNEALRGATSDWIIFLDADDKLPKNYIKTLYDEARKNNADVIYCGMHFIGSYKGTFESRPYTLRSLRRGNYINNSALMRHSLLLDIGGYNKSMDFGYEDWELYLALANKKTRFCYVNKTFLYYRRHKTNSRDINALEKLEQAHTNIRSLHPDLFSLSHRLKDLLYTIFTFHQRRTPLQLIRDIRYLIVQRLDKWGEKSKLINKFMGGSRLLISGNFNDTVRKIKLNLKRLFRKSI